MEKRRENTIYKRVSFIYIFLQKACIYLFLNNIAGKRNIKNSKNFTKTLQIAQYFPFLASLYTWGIFRKVTKDKEMNRLQSAKYLFLFQRYISCTSYTEPTRPAPSGLLEG
jgi:hypothetical protein